MKISEDFDFPEEKICNSEDDLESLNDSNENISDEIKITQSMNLFQKLKEK